MNLKEQRYVTVLAACGNITTAAERLFVSQPALSIYINNLENILGTKLFDRTGKKFIPTYAGELYIRKAKEMLHLNEEFEAELNSLLHNNVGELSIAIQLRRGPLLLPPVLAKFHQKYPAIKLVINEGVQEMLETLQKKDSCIFYINNIQEKRAEFTSHLLFKDRILLALPPSHPLLAKAEKRAENKYSYLDLRECLREPFILPTKKQSMRRQLETFFEQTGIYPSKILEVRNFETAMQMVAEGMGLAFNREQYASSMFYSKPLVYCTFSEHKLCTNNVYISHLKSHILTEYEKYALRLFLEQGKYIQNKEPFI